jgi:hypothetical protein
MSAATRRPARAARHRTRATGRPEPPARATRAATVAGDGIPNLTTENPQHRGTDRLYG